MQIRDFNGADFEPVAKELGRLWHSQHGDHSFWQGADELCDHLARTSKGLVAQDEEGALLGVILLKSPNPADQNETLRMHWLQQRTRLAAMANALGINARADVVYLQEEAAFMEEAGQDLGTQDVGEVILLVVTEAARGQGVGNRLLGEGRAWLAQRGAKTVRLLTDDQCDWQFYEHLGMRRAMERPMGNGSDGRRFIFEVDC